MTRRMFCFIAIPLFLLVCVAIIEVAAFKLYQAGGYSSIYNRTIANR